MAMRAIPLCLMLLSAGFPGLAVAAAPVAAAPQTAEPSVIVTGAWERVVAARTWTQQAHEVHGFLNALRSTGRRPAELGMDARDIASNRSVRLDDPVLLRRPQAVEVTLTLDGRFYVFRPLSRASLEPLLRR